MKHPFAAKFPLYATLLLATSLTYAEGKTRVDVSPTLPGAELVSPALLGSARHQVIEPVRIEGHFGRFIIDSKVGKFSVIGANMLAVRVHELHAIEELQKVQQDSAFTDALAKSAGNVAAFAKNAVTEPGQTVENIGKGVNTVFGRVGHLAKSGAAYVSDNASDLTASDARQKPQAAPNGEPEPPSFIGDPFGYNMARREWAKKLNIDPYTSNPILRPLLDKAAAASFAGNFGVSLTLGAVMVPIQYAFQLDDTVRQSIWNKPAIDLEKENAAKLAALGVKERTARDLLRNKWFTPSLQTALVARLESFGKIEGIDSVVAVAAVTQGESRVRFLLESLAMLSVHQKNDGRFAKVGMHNLVPSGETSSGAVVVAVAIDYGIWTEDAAAFVRNKRFNVPHKSLLVAGKLSPEALRLIEQAGWKVTTGLRT